MKAYLAGISTYMENEEIEIRYRIYSGDKLVVEKKEFQKYRKPLVVSHFALISLLRELRKMSSEEVEIVIHDAALNEQIRGTSTTKNQDVLKAVSLVKKEMEKLTAKLTITDVTANFEAKTNWDQEVSF